MVWAKSLVWSFWVHAHFCILPETSYFLPVVVVVVLPFRQDRTNPLPRFPSLPFTPPHIILFFSLGIARLFSPRPQNLQLFFRGAGWRSRPFGADRTTPKYPNPSFVRLFPGTFHGLGWSVGVGFFCCDPLVATFHHNHMLFYLGRSGLRALSVAPTICRLFFWW